MMNIHILVPIDFVLQYFALFSSYKYIVLAIYVAPENSNRLAFMQRKRKGKRKKEKREEKEKEKEKKKKKKEKRKKKKEKRKKKKEKEKEKEKRKRKKKKKKKKKEEKEKKKKEKETEGGKMQTTQDFCYTCNHTIRKLLLRQEFWQVV